MKISVIIPVKNRAGLLPYTLDSIFNQTFPPYEVIVVNDHSTDHLEEALAPYEQRIKLTNSLKNGPGAARNKGLEIATGDAIQFFDSDDIMSPNKLETQAAILSTLGKRAMVYGPHVKAEQQANTWLQRDVVMQYNPLPNGNLFQWVKKGWCPITQSVLFTKDLVDAAGMWREDIFPHEDLVYWYNVGKQRPTIAHENKSCVIYRQHGTQITDLSTTQIHKAKDKIMALEMIWNDLMATNDKLTFKDRIYQLGRMEGAKHYLCGLEKQKYPTNSNTFYWFMYRLINKYERMKTKSQWESMYGVLTMLQS